MKWKGIRTQDIPYSEIDFFIEEFKDTIKQESTQKLLDNKLVKSWLTGGDEFMDMRKIAGKAEFKKVTCQLENYWAKSIIDTYYKDVIKFTDQWSGKLGEQLCGSIMRKNGEEIWKPKNVNGLELDWESETNIKEVKTRNFTTRGSVGEKIFCVPFKYSDAPIFFNKPLEIVLVAYQEVEAESFKIFNYESLSKRQKCMMDTWKNYNIKFVKCSDKL